MAPKKSAKKSLIAPVESGYEVIDIMDVDLTDESGWRPINADRVDELLQEFLKGNYGLNVLKDPMLRAKDGVVRQSKNIKSLLADGKHKFKALQEAKALYDDPAEHEKYEWTDLLVAAFENGVRATLAEFPDDDPDMICAYQTAAHDESANKALWSDLKDFAKVAKTWQKRVAGGQWMDVQKKLEEFFPGRRLSPAVQVGGFE